ncbi:MAG: 50S ribosomal protein P1 [Candidatus Hydrothermarchaeales archaeon]
MEYVYAAMLLHAAGKGITEENLIKVLKAPGIKVDPTRAKALVAALEDIDIDEAISRAAVAPAATPAETPAVEVTSAEKKKKEEEEEEVAEEEAMAGLSALFG